MELSAATFIFVAFSAVPVTVAFKLPVTVTPDASTLRTEVVWYMKSWEDALYCAWAQLTAVLLTDLKTIFVVVSSPLPRALFLICSADAPDVDGTTTFNFPR